MDTTKPVHSFHIPVMGTGFTVNTPLAVARYGISSVVSILDDHLLEKMREYLCRRSGENYVPIARGEPDCRARRITAYLNLLNRLVKEQVERLKKELFTAGSEITKYFEMLDDVSEEKKAYRRMLSESSLKRKKELEDSLRGMVRPGSIDVNIMVKVDRDIPESKDPTPQSSEAMSALRGYAKSDVESRIVFSAGLNARVYSYISSFSDFYPDAEGRIRKKVVLKVSDYRSALIQGRFLAKKGVWVSEFRIESGLNCGGHAFATQGHLLGPVLEEFKDKREELRHSLWEIYREAAAKNNRTPSSEPLAIHVTAQGGVGTSAEHRFLKRHYGLDSVGWGTPFLLVPEATNVDDDTLQKLVLAGQDDIELSQVSPLNVLYYSLKTSKSEESRLSRIRAGRPGSPCPNGHLALNTEFGKPLCTASYAYQKQKIASLKESKLEASEYSKAYESVVSKACICHDLGSGALLKYGLKDPSPNGRSLSPAICPGPNLAFFSKTFSLEEMVGHIYGRVNVLSRKVPRPHMFINELKLYVDYLRRFAGATDGLPDTKKEEFFAGFRENLREGIRYYKKLAASILEETEEARAEILRCLDRIELEF